MVSNVDSERWSWEILGLRIPLKKEDWGIKVGQ